MNTKKALIVLSVIFSISLTLLVPFSISADTQLDPPFLGVNVNAYAVDHWGGKFNIGKINLTAYDPQNEVGNIRGRLECQTWDATGGCKVFQGNNTVTNGLHMTIPEIYVAEQATNGSFTGQTASYVYEYEFVLDNYYVGYFVTTVNQSSYTVYVNGTSASLTTIQNTTNEFDVSITDYELSLLDNNKMYWQFPMESYPAIQYLYNQGFEQVGMNNGNNYLYPIFQKDDSKYMVRNVVGPNGKHIVIMFTTNSVSGQTNFNIHYKYNSNFSIDTYENLRASASGYIIKVTFKNNSSSNQNLELQCNNNNGKFFVIFNSNVSTFYNVSDDFAYLYRLNNGNPETSVSVTNADNTNNQLGNKIDNENDIVSGHEDTLSDDLENLDISNKNNDLLLNQKFLSSANWVRLRFNELTENNVYGYMITFSMVIGLSLVIIGKLRG